MFFNWREYHDLGIGSTIATSDSQGSGSRVHCWWLWKARGQTGSFFLDERKLINALLLFGSGESTNEYQWIPCDECSRTAIHQFVSFSHDISCTKQTSLRFTTMRYLWASGPRTICISSHLTHRTFSFVIVQTRAQSKKKSSNFPTFVVRLQRRQKNKQEIIVFLISYQTTIQPQLQHNVLKTPRHYDSESLQRTHIWYPLQRVWRHGQTLGISFIHERKKTQTNVQKLKNHRWYPCVIIIF
jgi:hypothetical protein